MELENKHNPKNEIKSILENNLQKINNFLNYKDEIQLKNFIKELHNADIAEIIQNLDSEIQLKFILKIKSYFDPEILTYLNESIKEEIIENLDIKQLASNASELDVDDALDVIEDLEESDKEVFLDNIPEKMKEN